MNTILPEILSLLSSEAGGLIYQLVLAFSIAGALLGAILYARAFDAKLGYRMAAGLGGLLLLRLALFAASGLTWQGLANPGVWLALVDRGIAILSLILIIWLWVFPAPSRIGDSATLILALLSITLLILAGIWRSQQAVNLPLSETLASDLIDIYSISLIVLGFILLLIRQPPGWGFGGAMLVGLAIGYLLNLFAPLPKSDYAMAVRLAQMATFPILLVMPYRFYFSKQTSPQTRVSAEAETAPAHLRRLSPLDPSTLQVILRTNDSRGEINLVLARAIAQALHADIGIFLKSFAETEQVEFDGGYDVIRDQVIPAFSVAANLLPTLKESYTQQKVLRLPPASSAPELTYLAKSLKLARSGGLLSARLNSPNGCPSGIILLTPYSNNTWTEQDENSLLAVANQTAELYNKLQQQKDEQTRLVVLQGELERSLEENQALIAEITALQKGSDDDRAQLLGLTALISSLHHELEQRETIQPGPGIPAISADSIESTETPTDTREELRLALLEIAYLSSLIDEKQNKPQKDSEGSNKVRAVLPADRIEPVLALAEELRQPIASSKGYIDALLSESLGILVDRQRKTVEHIRLANERMTRILDELLDSLNQASILGAETDKSEIDLPEFLQEAVAATAAGRDTKQIALTQDIPDDLPPVEVDRRILK